MLGTLFRSKPAVTDPHHRFGLRESQAVRTARHRATYAAMNELAETLGLRLEATPPFEEGMGIEDFVQSVGDVARAAVVELKKR